MAVRKKAPKKVARPNKAAPGLVRRWIDIPIAVDKLVFSEAEQNGNTLKRRYEIIVCERFKVDIETFSPAVRHTPVTRKRRTV